jgi:hypothetical protein
LAIFAAIRRASSRVSSLGADRRRRCGQTPERGEYGFIFTPRGIIGVFIFCQFKGGLTVCGALWRGLKISL